MTTGWSAPRTAYLMTAARAEGDMAECDVLWKGLSYQERAELVLALAAQTRYAVHCFAGDPDVRDLVVQDTCAAAQRWLACAYIDGDTRGIAPPECDHCLRICVDALMALRIGIALARGVDAEAIAVGCRNAASR